MTRRLERLELAGPVGHLEALWTLPLTPGRGSALVCHPHPQYGGTMHTKAVYRTARAFLDAGCCVLRFNFRGVGRSAGRFDSGRGELDDARAALDWLRQRNPQQPIFLAGFSFGSYIALRLAEERDDVYARVALGVPLDLFDFDFLEPDPRPLLLVSGGRDPFSPSERLRSLGARLGGATQVTVLPGAGHLLLEALPQLHDAVQSFATAVLERSVP